MTPRPILEIGEQLGLREDELIPYGRHKAKVALKGRPSGFTVPISELRLLAGAGFLTAVCSGIQLLPGLPTHQSGEHMDLDPVTGEILGLE